MTQGHTEQRLLFCSLHFEANDFPVPGLRVWAVTFSHENIFGFDKAIVLQAPFLADYMYLQQFSGINRIFNDSQPVGVWLLFM